MIMSQDSKNELIHLAYELVCHTGRNVFLTGKAGTGKTTFLRKLVSSCDKRLVVVAPTGVAAINAGGVTMHSQFNLPLEATHYLHPIAGPQVFNGRNFFRNIRLSAQKVQVLKELELLIIDEVSMVRVDMLDMVDLVLRHYRRSPLPFGGVQILMIGDLFQLSPVLKPEEWERLKVHYQGHFFFHAKAFQELNPVRIELKNVFRQKDQQFVDILNQVREGKITREVLEKLNQRWDPDFQGPEMGYITLCTHNKMADSINQYQLEKLEAPIFQYFGEISGDFNEKALPAEEVLSLKVGARVMFIRNDSSEARKYYNGKQGVITHLEEDEIWVDCGSGSILIGEEIWENVQYSFNKEKDKIEEEILGSFSQFPIRLAWAITIHKSQGLTFDKVVVDAGQSFSSGQVYVALSRCTTLEGLVLKSKIPSSAVFTDGQVIDFNAVVDSEEMLQEVLEKDKMTYMATRMLNSFTMTPILDHLKELEEMIPNKRIPHPEVLLSGLETIKKEALELEEVCEKSKVRFIGLIQDPAYGPESELFQSRVKAAIPYFLQKIQTGLLDVCRVIFNDLKVQKGVKGLVKELLEFKKTIENQRNRIQKVNLGGEFFFIPPTAQELVKNGKEDYGFKKAEKGETFQISLAMYKEGKSIKEIAEERGFAMGTIEGHLARFVASGEIDLEGLLSAETIQIIESQIKMQPDEINSGQIKSALGDKVSWGEIRLVLARWNRLHPVSSEK